MDVSGFWTEQNNYGKIKINNCYDRCKLKNNKLKKNNTEI